MKHHKFSTSWTIEPRYARTRGDRFTSSMNINSPAKSLPKSAELSKSVYFSGSFSCVPRFERLENRKIDSNPFKVLDAGGIINDFYLDLLDYSENEIISLGIQNRLYSYVVKSREIKEMLALKEDVYVSSAKSSKVENLEKDGEMKEKNILAVGLSDGCVVLLDLDRRTLLKKVKVSTARIGVLSWNGKILSCGGKDGKIRNIDILEMRCLSVFKASETEVCGLEWCTDGKYLACGTDDNVVSVWQLDKTKPRCRFFGHNSAVKALAWCPWRNGILLSGGGKNDKTIKEWSIQFNRLERSTAVEGPVSKLLYVKRYREIISAVGGEISVWKATGMKKIVSFGRHEGRVLGMVKSPSEETLVTVGADENLKFWKIMEKKEEKITVLGIR